MNISATSELTASQQEAILAIWNEEYPMEINYPDVAAFNAYLDGLTDKQHLLLTDNEGAITGWAFSFVRDGEQWFAILLGSKAQGKGYGAQLLNELKKKNTILNGWTIDHNKGIKKNGTAYRSPIEFYLKNGFSVVPEVRLETEKISAVKVRWIAKSEL